jgi:RNA polymerase sigma factor (sigma-70 family)
MLPDDSSLPNDNAALRFVCRCFDVGEKELGGSLETMRKGTRNPNNHFPKELSRTLIGRAENEDGPWRDALRTLRSEALYDRIRRQNGKPLFSFTGALTEKLIFSLEGLYATSWADLVPEGISSRADMPAQLNPFVARALNAQVTDLLPDLVLPPTHGLEEPLQPDVKNQCPSKWNRPNINPPTNLLRTPAKPILEARRETTPLDALILAETRTALMAMIRTLDRKHREVLLLYFYSGLKVTQIAAKLNLPVSNISARLCRACGKLRRLLCGDSQWRSLRQEFQDQFPHAEMS